MPMVWLFLLEMFVYVCLPKKSACALKHNKFSRNKPSILKMSGIYKKTKNYWNALKTILCKNMNHETESLNAMNVATVFEEKIVVYCFS